MTNFSLLDYIVVATYLIGVVVLGLVFSKRQTSLKEYYHASSSLPWWAVGISMIATQLSPISYLAIAGWIFLKDSRTSFSYPLIGIALVPLTAAIWLPLWSRMRLMTIYEYLETRFHPLIRTLGALQFLLSTLCWVGTALVATSLGFQHVTGFDGRWCLTIITLLGTLYTMIGGMRAVIWTDVAQFLVLVVGYAVTLLTLLYLFDWRPLDAYQIASSTISAETGYPHTKLISFEFDLKTEATIWVVLLVQLRLVLEFGASQYMVQRLHAARSRRDMLKSIYSSRLCEFGVALLSVPVAWGLVAFYAQHPEMKAGLMHPDQVLPDFTMQHLPTVFRSLIMAGVLAALMSTLDSSLNSMSNVMINDLYRRYFFPKAAEKHLVRAGKVLTLLIGLLIFLFALWQFDPHGDNALEKVAKLMNVFASPLICFFLLGIASTRSNTPGVLIGAVAGTTFAITFNGFPGLFEPILNWINWMWVASLAIVVNLIVGYLASLLFPSGRQA